MTIDDRDNIPEWDDRKTLASVFQSHHAFPVPGLSEQFYSAVVAVAQVGYQRRLEAETLDTTLGMEAAIRLARADAYRQGVKDGRAAVVEELSQIVDDDERVQALRKARRDQSQPR